MSVIAILGMTVSLATAPPAAPAQSAFDTPPGSWRNSCTGGVVINGRLNAQCQDSRGFPRNSYLEISSCGGREIVNDNGNLTCSAARERPRRWAGPGRGRATITVYQHVGYQGSSRTYTGAVANLVPEGWNDVVSSMTMRGRWEVCTDVDYRGRCEVFNADVSNVVPLGLNDQISSLRPAY